MNPQHRRVNSHRRKPAVRRRSRLTRLEWWIICLLSVILALAFVFFALTDARLVDQKDKIRKEEEAYERRVYRTTVKYRDLIKEQAVKNGLRPAFLAAVILNESSYDPTAIVERTNARGLMQLLPSAANTYKRGTPYENRKLTDEDLFDPEINVTIGANYIRILSARYAGDPVLVACAYHAGPNNVDYWLFRNSSNGRSLSINEIPMADTRQYAKKVVDSYAIYQEHYYKD